MDEDAEFHRLYGPVETLRPDQVGDYLGEFGGPWWIVGGWAIEALTGYGATTMTSTSPCCGATCPR